MTAPSERAKALVVRYEMAAMASADRDPQPTTLTEEQTNRGLMGAKGELLAYLAALENVRDAAAKLPTPVNAVLELLVHEPEDICDKTWELAERRLELEHALAALAQVSQ